MTEEERVSLSPKERERLEAAEHDALKMLSYRMREGRRSPRRHQRFVFLAIFGILALVAVAALLAGVIRRVIF